MVTLREVAQAAGVSPSTASAALRGMDIVKPQTRKKVTQAAERLHYRANLPARALRSGRSGIFTLIVPDLENAFYARLANSLATELDNRDLRLIIQVSQFNKDKELSQVSELTSSMCDGLFICSTHNSGREIGRVSHGLPVLLFDDMSTQENTCFDSIETPSREGIGAAIRHLYDCGRRRIGIVGGFPPSNRTPPTLGVTLRENRYKQALATLDQLGLDSGQALVPSDWTTREGRLTAHHLVEDGLGFDALCCMNDSLALGILRGLAECGIQVPGQVAVTGFDGIAPGGYITPTLTTVAVDFTSMAVMAVSMMEDQLGGRGRQSRPMPRRIIVGYRLLKRESTVGRSAAGPDII
ncbi:LacI family DNA-binding transcriptional regulator [Bifidobacterium favimelis]|uniref:LacI family DNA-binding transcriptional regulator n=1 Tax=Bifidobacterium favimelis TaxID=3122979 RepID=A0ABU8ZQ81_9BIFI